MTIPSDLLKSITDKCVNQNDHFLAVRFRTVVKNNVLIDLVGEQPQTFSSTETIGDFIWRDSGIKYTSKPVVTRPTVNLLTTLANITSGSRADGTYGRRIETINRVGTNIVINGTVYDFNGKITYDVFTESGDFFDFLGNNDNQFGISKDERTSTVEIFIVACGCQDGEKVDCPGTPLGFCCIQNSLITSLCNDLDF